ncbi:hypothetical protein [Niabella ginsengisoli]|uniref:Uncharacterized protein n=1 Tax=Niabella ginsengisoli TaxID=522298 RepID=A0ABS9SN11_9BACT|nr:hypothetical protein [Niabella ginsengisoli]MCH5599760.1 hypothetical protein [Niabella ginsengisoli]
MINNKKLNDFYKKLSEKSKTFIGYPCSVDYDYSELYPFLQFAINNIGDPTLPSSADMNSHDFEREVLSFLRIFLKLPKITGGAMSPMADQKVIYMRFILPVNYILTEWFIILKLHIIVFRKT